MGEVRGEVAVPAVVGLNSGGLRARGSSCRVVRPEVGLEALLEYRSVGGCVTEDAELRVVVNFESQHPVDRGVGWRLVDVKRRLNRDDTGQRYARRRVAVLLSGAPSERAISDDEASID